VEKTSRSTYTYDKRKRRSVDLAYHDELERVTRSKWQLNKGWVFSWGKKKGGGEGKRTGGEFNATSTDSVRGAITRERNKPGRSKHFLPSPKEGESLSASIDCLLVGRDNHEPLYISTKKSLPSSPPAEKKKMLVSWKKGKACRSPNEKNLHLDFLNERKRRRKVNTLTQAMAEKSGKEKGG